MTIYKILIADDKEVFRRKFKRLSFFKENNDFEVVYEVQNGLEALEVLRSNQVDVVVTDIRMPIVTGIELLKKTKNEMLCDCVILLSEYTDFSYAKDGLTLGAFDYIVKPIDNEKIQDVMERVKEFMIVKQRASYLSDVELDTICKYIAHHDDSVLKYVDGLLDAVIEHEGYERLTMIVYDILQNILAKLGKTITYIDCFIDIGLIESEVRKYAGDSQREMKFYAYMMIKGFIEEFNAVNLYSNNELITKVSEYVVKHIEENISLADLSDKYFVNKNYLSHIFKVESGRNFVDYVSYCKVAYAKIALLDNNIKVYEVASALGYKDTEYFSRLFKKYTQENPSEYRRKRLNEK